MTGGNIHRSPEAAIFHKLLDKVPRKSVRLIMYIWSAVRITMHWKQSVIPLDYVKSKLNWIMINSPIHFITLENVIKYRNRGSEISWFLNTSRVDPFLTFFFLPFHSDFLLPFSCCVILSVSGYLYGLEWFSLHEYSQEKFQRFSHHFLTITPLPIPLCGAVIPALSTPG